LDPRDVCFGVSMKGSYDVVIIGGGQSGLATAYYLRRTGLTYLILDAQAQAGGAWRHGWESLRLFSPARWSSLPGRLMPGGEHDYPHRDEVVRYLEAYEKHYALPVIRPVTVRAVRRAAGGLEVETASETLPKTLTARAVVSATGTWTKPYVPAYPGLERFEGESVHSAHYRAPEPFAGQRVLVVGAGNSGAQILAEVSKVAETTWVSLEPPTFHPDDVDGRVLFDRATAQYRGARGGADASGGLAKIVMVPSVKEARERGILEAEPMFERFTATGVRWAEGREAAFDVVIWCTGFRPALDHLAPLGVVRRDGRVSVRGTRAAEEPRLWLVGYGSWTGFASATLVGVGRSARATVRELEGALAQPSSALP
jgi:putative flavoprotein involved in K+ transport